MATPCSEYEKFGMKADGQYQQLNANTLQIENEYYASVRPKPLIESGKKPLDSLNDKGVAYIELRSLDINPALPMGIDETQIHFLEVFLLFCLLKDSPAISTREQFEIDSNDQLIAHEGRRPNLKLKHQKKELSIAEFGAQISTDLSLCASLFDKSYAQAVSEIVKRFDNSELTPSAQVLEQMKSQGQGFFDHINTYAKQYRQDFLAQDINQAHFDYLDEQAEASCQRQREIEAADTLSFDQYLAQYFHQV